MKITELEIRDFNQFKDFKLDLTYPKGHPKEGKPLEKVCFIGQSGTGKTSLLRMIQEMTDDNDYYKHESEEQHEWMYLIRFAVKEYSLFIAKLKRDGRSRAIFVGADAQKVSNYFLSYPVKQIFYPAEYLDLVEPSQSLSNPLDYVSNDKEIQGRIDLERKEFEEKKSFEFGIDKPIEIWKHILSDSREYRIGETKYRLEIVNLLMKDADKTHQLVEEFKNWKSENQSPIHSLAESLNPLLKEFNLRVSIDFNFEKPEDFDFIKIETLNGQNVPFGGWSTGTKQIVMTATPLFKLDTTNTVIMMDEPERSLYPDLQQKIIPYYSELAPEAQFFYATHSPIIASCFEPWEVVELEFGEDGFVQQKPYFTGERHVDNYHTDPRLLRWDSILSKMFDVEEEGNDLRTEKLMELAMLESEIKKMKAEGADKSEIQPKWEAYKKLAELLDWKIN
ncbi:MAG: GTPase SAR1 family protein [Bacteroidia bacterium]|jgi:GTPase SAR1 family protein